jgi:energy-coupling factor transporter ATP-binding protein EcfA2
VSGALPAGPTGLLGPNGAGKTTLLKTLLGPLADRHRVQHTFGLSMSHTTPWTLPIGAPPWPEAIESAVRAGDRPGTRALTELPDLGWYREAHNDYVQTLVETGVPGLLIALWAAVAALGAVRRDPWLLAAVASVLMHAFVDFDLQIPAIPVLLVCLVAMRPDSSFSQREPSSSGTAS